MRKVKSKVLTVVISALMVVSLGLVGCGQGNNAPASTSSDKGSTASSSTSAGTTGAISVVSREDGSGTRAAFTELAGVLNADKKDATTENAVVTNSTSVMMTTVAGDPKAIGYVSMGSLNDTVKALKVGGVEATTDNVKKGSYAIQRPFMIADKGNLSPAAADFLKYILSKEGQAIISKAGFIAVDDKAAAYSATSGLSGKVIVAGSSSVSPAMQKIIEGYKALNSAVDVELQTSDSSTGVKNVVDGVCDLGMASRELKDSELAKGITPTKIALDGIAVVVSKDNSVSDLSLDQIKGIFLGEIKDWSDVAK